MLTEQRLIQEKSVHVTGENKTVKTHEGETESLQDTDDVVVSCLPLRLMGWFSPSGTTLIDWPHSKHQCRKTYTHGGSGS